MPHDPITVRTDLVEKTTHGGHDRLLISKYEAPAAPDGGIAEDPYQARDWEVKNTMMRWLEKHYPGHLWGCIADLRHGIVRFNIPVLMGVNDWWVVNLATHDIIDGMRQGAGQILERYGLRRGRFQIDEFLDARAKHSKLVFKTRKIPD